MSEAQSLEASAERAFAGEDVDGASCFRGRPPADALTEAMRALGPALIAIVLWALAVARAQMDPPPLDPYVVFFRILALFATLRAIVSMRAAAKRVVALRRASEVALAVMDDGVVLREGAGQRAITRGALLGVHPGDESTAPALLVMPERGEAIVQLPVGLEDRTGRISEALEALVEAPDEALEETAPPARAPSSSQDAERIYDRAACGDVAPGVAVAARSLGWLVNGPYGALIVALVLGERILRLPDGASVGPLVIGALALSAGLVLVFLGLGARRARAARGMAAVLTPDALLLRLPEGLVRVAFAKVSGVEVVQRRAWSTLGGRRIASTVYVHRAQGPSVALSQDVLRDDPYALASLIALYGSGVVAESSATAAASSSGDQGSGAGGSTSAVTGTKA